MTGAGRPLRRQAERQLTGDIRTRLLYVAITSPTRAGSLPPRFEPCHFSDFLKRSFSSNEKAELELQLASQPPNDATIVSFYRAA